MAKAPCVCVCHAPNLAAVPSDSGHRRCVSAAGSRKRQPGLATRQCRASSRVTSHMKSSTLIGRSSPGRRRLFYPPSRIS
eukprot:3144412-Prymnesium_polylepis.1